jgi:hypothetical protein
LLKAFTTASLVELAKFSEAAAALREPWSVPLARREAVKARSLCDFNGLKHDCEGLFETETFKSRHQTVR